MPIFHYSLRGTTMPARGPSFRSSLGKETPGALPLPGPAKVLGLSASTSCISKTRPRVSCLSMASASSLPTQAPWMVGVGLVGSSN